MTTSNTTGLRETLADLVAQCEASGVTQIPAGEDRPDLKLLRKRLDRAKAALSSPNGSGEQVSHDDLLSGEGFVYHNPDSGTEYAVNHPIESGECPDATDIRRSTIIEDALNADLQTEFTRAERLSASGPVPDGWVTVPHDDDKRDFADSQLPLEMIHAGMDVLEKVHEDGQKIGLDVIDWDDGMVAVAVYRAMLAVAPAPALPEAKPVASVKTMKLSDGRADYYVSVAVGDREITPHVYRIKGRAEFDVANWNWLLNGGEKPEIRDWLDRTADPDETPPKPVASPAEGEADTKFLSILANDPNAVHINLLRGSLARPSLAQIIHIYGADALREALAASSDREAGTREAVTDEMVLAVAKVLAGFNTFYPDRAALKARLIRALAQQAKPQQAKP